MSIIYNNQVVAGKYTQQVVADADTVNAGIIKIATEQQVNEGVDNTTAVTPFYLAQKQDKISAGNGIVIDNNEISCIINPDEQTIVHKDNGTIQCIGQLTKSNTLKFDWEGTQAEYNVAYLNGIIQPDWYCYITDDEQFVDYADVCNQSLSNLRPDGEARFDAKLNLNLDNINKEGEKKLNDLVLDKANIDLTNITDIGIQVIKDNSKVGSGFNLFDTKISDHILEGESAKGWALQGTYVNGAVYPDFYAKCIEEYNEATNIETVNGVTVKVNANGHKFYDIADKTAIDEFYNSLGSAWFYGIDTENKRIFLPRDNYFAVKGNVSVAGNGLALGLINSKGEFAIMGSGDANAYASPSEGIGQPYGTSANAITAVRGRETWGLHPDFAKSGIEGQLTPNEEKYLYICVGNTEVTQAITNVTEITTSENDTIPLFTGMYFDFKPNNASWLKAGEQQNSAGIYKTCYDTLVEIVNGINNYDLKVINIADMISGIDYSEYWILNQDNLTFRTPTTISNKVYSNIAPVVGNGMALGFTDGTNVAGMYLRNLTNLSGSATPMLSKTAYGETLGVNYGKDNDTTWGTPYTTAGITTDPSKSGIEAHLVENTEAQLYFKVANAVQNIELLDVGRVMEQAVLRSTLVEAQVVIETYVNGGSWYRVWSDGWCEQGGISAGQGQRTITLIRSFLNKNYNLVGSSDSLSNTYDSSSQILSTSQFIVYTQTNNNYFWQACGYIW